MHLNIDKEQMNELGLKHKKKDKMKNPNFSFSNNIYKKIKMSCFKKK